MTHPAVRARFGAPAPDSSLPFVASVCAVGCTAAAVTVTAHSRLKHAVNGGTRPLAPADDASRDLLRSYGCR